jgi:hypothetical protein
MPVCEQLHIALQDNRDRLLDASVALGQGGFGPGSDLAHGGPEGVSGGVLEVRGRRLRVI